MEFSRIIYAGKNHEQWRLTCSEFREVEYIHLRKYFQDMEGDWKPTKDGAAFPLTINNSWALFLALAELLSSTELNEGLKEVFQEYESTNNTTVSRERIKSLL